MGYKVFTMKRSAVTLIFCLSLAHCGRPSGSVSAQSSQSEPSASNKPSPSNKPSASNNAPASNQPAPETSNQATPSVPAPAAVDVVMASGVLQQCLGISPGGAKMKGPGAQQACKQLPGASIYDQAGERFQAGDHAGA